MMKNKKRIIIANWKMNPRTAEEARKIFSATSRTAKKFKNAEVVVCPPVIFLSLFKKPAIKNLSLGVQDIFWEQSGAHTGEISVGMAMGLGATNSIIGHSERRVLGESDETVSKKVLSAVRAGARAVVCVGERERDSGGAYFEFLKNQIRASLAGLKQSDLQNVIIAYEPVWAIGKSFKDAMKPADVYETAIFIKKVLADIFGKPSALSVSILYGGSVNFENAEAIISEGEVDGLLVGRESLDTKNFAKLISVINEI